MFEIAYLHPNGLDLIGLSESFLTLDTAQAALLAFRASLGAEPAYVPERCIVLEIPEPMLARFQIMFHDGRSKATWEGIPSNGKRYWHSEKAARFALNRLIQRLTREDGPVDSKNFEVEGILWKTTPDHRPRAGRYGRRVPWKIGTLKDGQRVYTRG